MDNKIVLGVDGDVWVVAINHSPVNAINAAVRHQLMSVLAYAVANERAGAIVLTCTGKTFCCGSDLREFDGPIAPPALPEVIEAIQASPKPVVASIFGNAFGGGMELVLGCHFRIAQRGAVLALPEVTLGLIPGAGGTQRLARLCGIAATLDIATTGRKLDAEEALRLGVIDDVFDSDIDAVTAGSDFAKKLLKEGIAPRSYSGEAVAASDPDIFDRQRARVPALFPRRLAPLAAIDAVELATRFPLEEGLREERKMFLGLAQAREARALRHAFFGERECMKKLAAFGAPKRFPWVVGILGGGTMGRGLVLAVLDAGLRVILFDPDPEARAGVWGAAEKHCAKLLARGKIDGDERDRRLMNLALASELRELGRADVVIEAAPERLDLKQELFSRLEGIVSRDCILATNTSYLDIDIIARGLAAPERVIGLHFFNPAHVMRLVEVVRAERTGDDAVAAAYYLVKRLGKVGVLMKNSPGFVGNRMLQARNREAYFLLEEGATPWQIDNALSGFGFAMGPFAVADMSGLEIGHAYRSMHFDKLSERERRCDILDRLVTAGRLGRKSGAGFYRYAEGERTPTPDPLVERMIVEHSERVGIRRREIGDHEIVERCLAALSWEGGRILDEGLVDGEYAVDTVWVTGYGFPREWGGPMFRASEERREENRGG